MSQQQKQQQLNKARNLSDKTNFFTFLLQCSVLEISSSVLLFNFFLNVFSSSLSEGKTQRLDSEHYCFR